MSATAARLLRYAQEVAAYIPCSVETAIRTVARDADETADACGCDPEDVRDWAAAMAKGES